MSLFLRKYPPKLDGTVNVVYAYDFRVRKKRYAGTLGPITDMEQANARYAELRSGVLALSQEAVRHTIARKLAETERQLGLTLSFPAFVEKYLVFYRANYKPSSIERVEQHLRLQLLPAFGTLRLDQILPWTVEQFKTQQQAVGYAPMSINKAVAHLKAMLTQAVAWGDLAQNPVKVVKRFTPPEHLRILSDEEEPRLLAACSVKFRPVVIVALHTGFRIGFRRGTLMGLTWSDVDFSERRISVRGALSKTGKGYTVPMTHTVYDLLSGRAGVSSASVFGYRYSSVDQLFRRASNAAGIEEIRFHDLRHTFASRLLMAGVDVATVKELMGHSNIQSTMIYSHLSLEHKRTAIAAFERSHMREGPDSRQVQVSLTDAETILQALTQLGIIR